MNPFEQFHLKQILHEISVETGVEVSQANAWQVRQRIRSLCTKYSIPSLYALRQLVQSHQKYTFWDELLECVLVQESYFFRDMPLFTKLEQEVIPQILHNHSPIRIWSAAAAQGQEIYSIAIMGHKTKMLSKMELYASDISKIAIEAAKEGRYSYNSLQRSIQDEDITHFFYEDRGKWRLHEEIREQVSFFQHNILHPCTKNNDYHIIILKNVLMYLSVENRHRAIKNAQRALHKDGVIIVSNPNTQFIQKDSTL